MAAVKVGIIGVGGIARTHVPGWLASEHAELIGGSDISQDVLQAWGREHDVSKLTTDAQELIDDPDIDIIDICTPSTYHAPLAIAALEAGKHVICEKPLAPTPGEIRQMIEARNRSGKSLMTAQHFRFQGGSRAMKAQIDTRRAGRHLPRPQLDAAPRRRAHRTRVHAEEKLGRWTLHRHRRPHSRPDAVVHGKP